MNTSDVSINFNKLLALAKDLKRYENAPQLFDELAFRNEVESILKFFGDTDKHLLTQTIDQVNSIGGQDFFLWNNNLFHAADDLYGRACAMVFEREFPVCQAAIQDAIASWKKDAKATMTPETQTALASMQQMYEMLPTTTEIKNLRVPIMLQQAYNRVISWLKAENMPRTRAIEKLQDALLQLDNAIVDSLE